MTTYKILSKVLDTFRFNSVNPPYDQVQKKMEDLKELGWTQLHYKQGYKYVGREPWDSDFIQNASITGMRKPVKADFVNAIKDICSRTKICKTEIKERLDSISKLTREVEEDKKDIKRDQKNLRILRRRMLQLR